MNTLEDLINAYIDTVVSSNVSELMNIIEQNDYATTVDYIFQTIYNDIVMLIINNKSMIGIDLPNNDDFVSLNNDELENYNPTVYINTSFGYMDFFFVIKINYDIDENLYVFMSSNSQVHGYYEFEV